MIIDTHCHFDMYPSPESFIQKIEDRGDVVIGMTNLPSHFSMGYDHVQNFRHVRLSLGLHPQLAMEGKRELYLFHQLVEKTSYIGEIGLDFSKNYNSTKEIQISNLRSILSCLQGKKKLVSVHSRKAEDELLSLLLDFGIENVIFHWYSGKLSLIPSIISSGYYFSINEAMTLSHSGKSIIDKIPHDRILMETDAPYNSRCSIQNAMKNIGVSEMLIKRNFDELISRLK